MSIKITMNHANIIRLINAQKQAFVMTAEALKTDAITKAVTPKDTGELEGSAFIDNTRLNEGKLKLSYTALYASRVYFHPEYNFRTDKNKNAQGRWLDSYIDGDRREFAQKAFRKFFRQLSGGIVQ